MPRGARRQYEQLQPILDRALGLTHDALDDAWQRFEILRLTTLVLAHPDFETRRDTYLKYKKSYETLNEQSPTRRGAWMHMDQALAAAGQELTVDRLHLLMHDTAAGDPVFTNWSSTAITQLVRDLDTDPENPLRFISVITGEDDLRIALAAVNSQLAVQVHEHTKPGTPGTRAESDAVWLDIPVFDR